jgi:hypothetical protein
MVKIEFQSMSVDTLDFLIGENQDFSKIKVQDLKKDIKNHDETFTIHLENTRLKFNDKVLVNKKTLLYYGISENSVIYCEKFFEPSVWVGLSWFTRIQTQDAITGDIDDNKRAIMSCGHSVKKVKFILLEKISALLVKKFLVVFTSFLKSQIHNPILFWYIIKLRKMDIYFKS